MLKFCYLFLASFSLFLFSCSTPKYKDIQKVYIGMEKSSLLELMGNPNSAKFKNGQHEWTYNYYIRDVEHSKTFWIEKGKISKISRQKRKAQNQNSSTVSKKISLSTKEVKEIKRALKQKKKIKKYEQGFEDLEE